MLPALAGLLALAGCAGLPVPAGETLGLAGRDSSRPPRTERVPRPQRGSGEYQRSWGLKAIGADQAYRHGVTGRGVTVAVIDTGVTAAQPEVLRNVSARSVDLIPNRRAGSATDQHGGDVAGLVVSSLDGAGTVGVAYRGTVLSIRADLDGSCAKLCAVHGRDLARGIDYAVDNGARIIVLALTGKNPLASAEAAMSRAIASGAVIVAAAGNDRAGEPAWPARYAVDSRFAGSIIVAGATTWEGELARWSNRPGRTKSHFVGAPGQYIVTNCDTRFCDLVSGTSYSVAFVAGALALVMEGHPELSGREAAEALLAGARDAGRPGIDNVYGRGTLDVGRALRIADAASGARQRS
jgi:subtilisin family serine protease